MCVRVCGENKLVRKRTRSTQSMFFIGVAINTFQTPKDMMPKFLCNFCAVSKDLPCARGNLHSTTMFNTVLKVWSFHSGKMHREDYNQGRP